ncbi:MAG TPA: hypothetical protein VFS71_06995 [Flavobacterium sp.]|uniref:hypothetical protein n=1 Tax=Flavobacterium sp. TaxID=239 RepID=UPI002DB900FB|nr:hypothetical protein [Flavobacterium sp.]HEU4789413.1 hypothetical protein [Flavobacterium sp.]
MIKSQFSFRTFISVPFTITIFFFPIYLFINRVEAFGENYNLKFIFISSLILFVCFWLILGTVRRVLWIKINDEEIIFKNIFLSERKFALKEFDGFETTVEISRGGSHKVLYLMKNKKSLVHISEYYLANYKELKSHIETRMNNLGFVPFSLLTDWKRYK